MDHLSLEKPTMPDTLRPLGNFTPSLWGDRFSSFTLDTQLLEKCSKEVEVLKEEVKDMLVLDNDDVGRGKSAGAEKMVLIDALERLGVSYLFQKEIEELLENMFPKFEEYCHVFHDNLFMVSLHFRVFRRHGYDLSSGKWWKEWDLRSHIPYVRDRAVECFFYSTAVCFEPQYSLARLVLTKAMIMISILDDTYDAYGTYEELKCFTNAVQRWDMNAIDQLPKYMKPIYKALLNIHDEFYQEIMAKKGINYSVQYLEEAYKEVIRCYDVETEWLKKGYVQTMEEHLANALVTVTSPLLTTAAFVGMGEIATPEAFQWLQSQPRILMACSTIFRVINDIQSCKTEDERSHVTTGVDCYMKQYAVSRAEAIGELLKIIENAWIDINEEMMRPTMISRDLVIRVLNFTRLYGVVYKYNDGYTQPECGKDSIIALYEDSIPI
ncbi:hypothetical protein RHSIM_Rhsim12G0120300 [Rhododendron simsii]|uniref:Uncharacterized protein n=1 Tax=Rhododendron simsii TaxID=118357 RepID=A0A834L800_RHOSS|nr:hypothetical protein RHSIM_Rhsim12G0120300 [Rhododendron simsii]